MLEHSKNAFRGYPENALSFLKEIERNNNRPWFQENKSRYEDLIRTPSLDFIEAMGTRIEKKLSPHFLAVRKKVGGSLMRVYRDTRFSKDKTPTKLMWGFSFGMFKVKMSMRLAFMCIWSQVIVFLVQEFGVPSQNPSLGLENLLRTILTHGEALLV